MRRSSALAIFFILCSWASGNLSQAQEPMKPSLTHYTALKNKTLTGDPTDSQYWAQKYALQIDKDNALKKDIEALFSLYLSGAQIESKALKAEITQDRFLTDNFITDSSAALFQESLSRIQKVMPENKLVKAIEDFHLRRPLLPVHFRVFDDEGSTELSAYYESGTHKIKMSLDLILPGNWLTWFIHEHLHFFDPILESASIQMSEQKRLAQIAQWLISKHTKLNPDERKLLNSYFSDLTNVSIQAEWRDWIASTLFAQQLYRTHLISELPPCLSFIDEAAFKGKEMDISLLKTLWWKKLKEGFYVEPTELFADPWLKTELLNYVEQLNPLELPEGGLIELVSP